MIAAATPVEPSAGPAGSVCGAVGTLLLVVGELIADGWLIACIG